MDEETEAWTVPNCVESWDCINVDPNHSPGGPEYHILTVSLSAPWKTWPFVVAIFLPHVNHRRYATAYGRRTDALEHLNENNHSWAQLPHEWLELIYPMLVASQPHFKWGQTEREINNMLYTGPGFLWFIFPMFHGHYRHLNNLICMHDDF